MELCAVVTPLLHHGSEQATVVAGSNSVGIEWRRIAVHEVGAGALRHALQQQRFAQREQAVPAHVRHFQLLAILNHALAEEAHRLNETCRIYVNLMSANVRRRLQQLTGDGATGYRGAALAGSDQAEVFKALGLSVQELKSIDPALAFQKIAIALQGFANDGNKARAVQELFGRSLKDVAPLLKDVAEAGKLVGTVTKQQAEEAEKFNKELFALSKNATDAGRALVGPLLSAMNKLIEKSREFKASDFFGSIGKEFKANLVSDQLRGVVGKIEDLQRVIDSQGATPQLSKRMASLRAEAATLMRAASAASDALKGFSNAAGGGVQIGLSTGSGPRGSAPKLPNIGGGGKPPKAKGEKIGASEIFDTTERFRASERAAQAATDEALRLDRLNDLTKDRADALALARYLEWWIEIGAAGLAPESRRTYRYISRCVVEDVGDIPIGELRPADLQQTVGRMQAAGRSDATVYLVKAGISSALGTAVRLGLLGSNPAGGVAVKPPEAADRTVLTPAQVSRLVGYLTDVKVWSPVNAVVAMMLQTGVRIHEAVAPRASDLVLDGDAPVLHVQWQAAYDRDRGWHRRRPKSKRSRRSIPLPAEAVELVRRRLELHPRPADGEDWALGSTLGRPYSDTAISSALRKACQVTGAPVICPHECRTTYATNLARLGVDVVTLASLLGDTTETVTRHYVKTDPATAAAAVARLFAPRTGPAVS